MSADDRPFSALTLAELRLKAAQLEERAERLRAEQRASIPTSPGTAALGREIREVASRAREYQQLVELAKRDRTT